jgi:hypothetical protein
MPFLQDHRLAVIGSAAGYKALEPILGRRSGWKATSCVSAWPNSPRTRSHCRSEKHRASGLNLAIAAIALWNTFAMKRAVDHLRARDVAARDSLLAHLSPMGWAHISLAGDYLWTDVPVAGGFRH